MSSVGLVIVQLYDHNYIGLLNCPDNFVLIGQLICNDHRKLQVWTEK